MSDYPAEGLYRLVPVPHTSEQEEAKKRGYHLHYGDQPPATPTKDGLPVLWVQGKPTEDVLVVPMRPAVNLNRREVIVKPQTGVQYTLNGKDIAPGTHTVPGTGYTYFKVGAYATDGYTTTGKYEWPFTIGEAVPATPENLWVSDKAALRSPGTEINPPAPGTSSANDNAKYGHYKLRTGEKLNNGFGGYGTAQWTQLGAGWVVNNRVTPPVHYRSSWKVNDKGQYEEQFADTTTWIFPHTRNFTLEIDFVESSTRPDQTMQMWIGAYTGLYMAEIGKEIIERNAQGDKLDHYTVPRGERTGTWKLALYNDIYTITTPPTKQFPQGRSMTQDFSKFNGVTGNNAVGGIGLRLNWNNITGLRVYKRKGEGRDNAQ